MAAGLPSSRAGGPLTSPDLARVQLDQTARAGTGAACLRAARQARRVVFVGGGAHAPLFGATIRAAIPRCGLPPARTGERLRALGAQPKKGKGRK